MPATSEPLGVEGTLRVLSIDGGGIRGVIPARILSELESIAGRPIADLFDVVAGTSTGGLIALSLTRPNAAGRPALTAEDVLSIYVHEGPQLFPAVRMEEMIRRRGWWQASRDNIYQRLGAIVSPRRFGNARYLATSLEATIGRALGDARLGDALADVVIPAYDWKAGRAMIFRSRAAREGEAPNPTMAQVARGTTAAPTYFPPLRMVLDDGHEVVLIDGGVAANNPITVALNEALILEQAMGKDLDVHVMSIGTGRPPEEIPTYQQLWSRGWLSLGMGMLGVVFDGTSEVSDELVRSLILKREPQSRYWRFQTDLRGCSLRMDDASDRNIAALLRLAERVIDDRREDLHEIALAVTGKPVAPEAGREDSDVATTP